MEAGPVNCIRSFGDVIHLESNPEIPLALFSLPPWFSLVGCETATSPPLPSICLVCIKNLIHVELESLEQGRSGGTAARKTSEAAVALLVQDQDEDGCVRGIDNPVFR